MAIITRIKSIFSLTMCSLLQNTVRMYVFTVLEANWFKLQFMSPKLGNLKTMHYGLAQGACTTGHAWFWDFRGLIVWNHASIRFSSKYVY